MDRVIIIYFSLTGNTEKLGRLTGDYLKEKGLYVDYYKLPTDQTGSFYKNAFDALVKKRIHLKETPDLSGYNLIFLGTPVWAFDITPAVRTLLEKVSLLGKKVFLFTTYGSGVGKEKAMRSFRRLAQSRNGEIIGTFDAQDKEIPGHFLKLKEVLAKTF